MANYETWMAALNADDDEPEQQLKKKLTAMRERRVSVPRPASAQPTPSPRSAASKRRASPPGTGAKGGAGASARRVTPRRRGSPGPAAKLGQPRPPPDSARRRRLKAAPKYNSARARANWSKLRTLWRDHGHEMAVWGRSYRHCFVEGAKFEWTTRELGTEVDWAHEEEVTHEQVDELLARRATLVDRLARITELRVQQERLEAEAKEAEAAAQKKAAERLSLSGNRGSTAMTPRKPKPKARASSRFLSPPKSPDEVLVGRPGDGGGGGGGGGGTSSSHLSMIHKRAMQRERTIVDQRGLERRIASVDQALRCGIKGESRLHSVTQVTKPPDRPSESELHRATQSARSGTPSRRGGDSSLKLSTTTERLQRQRERTNRQAMARMSGTDVVVQPPVESRAKMSVNRILQPEDNIAAKADGQACVRFTATIQYPNYKNITQANGTLCKHKLTIIEHSATRPWCCLAPLPNTYTIDLRKVDQLFYGVWPPHAEVDWRTGLKLPLPSRPAYLIQSDFAQSLRGQEQDPPPKDGLGTYGRRATTGWNPQGTVKRFARVADWDRGPTEAVNAKNYFTPRITKRLASAKKRHNERRAQSHKWIRLETAERERQNAVAQAATDEGTKIFLKHKDLHQKRSEKIGSSNSGGDGDQRAGLAGDRLSLKVNEQYREAKRRGESERAAQVRRVKAQQNQTSSASKSMAALMK